MRKVFWFNEEGITGFMFNVLFLFSILGGLGLGVWMAIRHAELYLSLLKMAENSTIASVGDVSDTFYDTEQVNEVEANPDENLDESLSVQQSLVSEEANMSPEQQEDSFIEINTKTEPIPEEMLRPVVDGTETVLQQPQNTDDHETQEPTVPIFGAETQASDEIQNETGQNTKLSQNSAELSPVVEIVSECLEILRGQSFAEAGEEITRMIPEDSEEMEMLAPLYEDVQNMLIEFENHSPEVVETQWISNAADSKYVNRVICRPRLGTR